MRTDFFCPQCGSQIDRCGRGDHFIVAECPLCGIDETEYLEDIGIITNELERGILI